MKVAYLVNYYPVASHSFIRREIIALEKKGVDVIRISIRKVPENYIVDTADETEQKKTAYVLNQSYIQIVSAFFFALWHNPFGLFAAAVAAIKMMQSSHRPKIFHFVYLVEACTVAKWVFKGGADHMHAHFGTNSAEVAMLAHYITQIPYSFTVHGPAEFDQPEYLGISAKVHKAAFVCAISSFGRSQLYRWIPHADWEKVKIVRCGLDLQYIDPPSPRPLPTRRLVCVGRICEQKGQLLLVEAAARLAARGMDFELVLAGDGEMRGEVEDRIAALGLEGKVTITGWVDSREVYNQIRAARALVLPSFAEGIPVVLMEAMALERPVVTTFVAGIPELVRDGHSGWLLPASDIDQLTTAICDCLDAPDARIAAMGRAGREQVLRLHDITFETAKLASLFEEAVDERNKLAHLPQPLGGGWRASADGSDRIRLQSSSEESSL